MSTGDLADREIDDLGEQVLSFAEIKALATGDPRIMEKAGVDSDIARLTRLERAHQEEQQRLRTLRTSAQDRAAATLARADRIAAVAQQTVDTNGDNFAMTIDGRHHAKRTDAGDDLRDVLTAHLAATPLETTVDHRGIAQLAGLDVDAQTITVIDNEIRLRVPDTEIDLRFVEDEWRTLDGARLVQRLERRIQRLPEVVEGLRAEARAASDEATLADELVDRPWEHVDQLARLRRRQQELDDALSTVEDSPGSAAPGPATTVAHIQDRLNRRPARQSTPGISV